jgi:HlyD family secretion protein
MRTPRVPTVPRTIGFLAPALLAVLLCGCGRDAGVQVHVVRRGPIEESFTEQGKTRLSKTWLVAMPVAGRIERVALEPGDAVRAGKELVVFDRVPLEKQAAEARAVIATLQAELVVKDYDRIEQTALVETKTIIAAAEEALKAAEAQVRAEQARADHAERNRQRAERLARTESLSESDLDDARLLAETSLIELRRQEFYRAALKAVIVAIKLGPEYIEEYLGRKRLERVVLLRRLDEAKARLERAEHELSLARIVSPIDGLVLEKLDEGGRALPAGHVLLRLGRMEDLEAVADVLTQDALRLTEGAEVRLEPAARLAAIAGSVRRIEPAGFTKLSSLGVEQERVNVLVRLEERPERLGVGFRVQVRFVTGRKDGALVVPRFSVLQEPDGTFYVMRIVEGRVERRTVRVGLRSDLELEIVEGLREGDRIVSSPDTTLEEGERVKVKGAGKPGA